LGWWHWCCPIQVDVVSCDKINEVYEILSTKNDAVKRYVLDIANTLGN
jgi:hypothetical protein